MPRSFLVKKIKLDDFSSSNVTTSNHHHHLDDSFTFARSITDSVTSLGVRLSENGELNMPPVGSALVKDVVALSPVDCSAADSGRPPG